MSAAETLGRFLDTGLQVSLGTPDIFFQISAANDCVGEAELAEFSRGLLRFLKRQFDAGGQAIGS